MSKVIETIQHHFSNRWQVELKLEDSPASILVPRELFLELAELLHTHPDLYFDSLACLTGIDNGVEFNSMEVVYNFYSIPFNHHLMVKVQLDRSAPSLPSVSSIWRTADWHEREAFDLLGIEFTNHPDLRRILMPADWEGHPLRKDYQDPQTYRGMQVLEAPLSNPDLTNHAQ